MASGRGSLLRALVQASREPDFGAQIVAVGVDRPCEAEHYAQTTGIPVFRQQLGDYPDRKSWDAALTDIAAGYSPDLVVTAGFAKLLGPAFLERFGGRIINSHPALLPAFPGMHGVREALDYGVRVTGTTIHLVDAGVDTGPILAQETVPVLPGDDEAEVHERIKIVERRLLPQIVAAVVRHGIVVRGRKATIPDE